MPVRLRLNVLLFLGRKEVAVFPSSMPLPCASVAAGKCAGTDPLFGTRQARVLRCACAAVLASFSHDAGKAFACHHAANLARWRQAG
jgi:hypothetical protein